MIVLPRRIHLRALGKTWRISYIHKPGKIMLYELPHRDLVIYGKNYAKRTAIKLLTRWIKMKSKMYFTAQLTKLNKKIKVNYEHIRIHSLQMEWGSYTSTKTLSLNYKLIFLPPSLVKHLMIHELCHIRHLNHSPAFWREVAKYDKRWKTHQHALFQADVYVPRWLLD